MAAATPIEFGQLLGLTQGVDSSPADVASTAEIRVILKTAQYLHTVSEHQRSIFFHELVALYLPCLLRTFLNLPFSPHDGDPRWSIYQTTTQRACDTPAFARFVREHPEETCGFFSSLIRSIADFSESGLETLGDLAGRVLERQATFVHDLVNVLCLYLPSNIPFPSLDEELRPDFDRVVNSLRPKGASAVDDVICLKSFSRGPFEVRNQEKLAEGSFLIWWGCHLRGDKTFKGKCVERERGMEMDACGRCLNVRYCSKAHQKLDWKSHKLQCFKPSW